jgi:tetratricopeptide (TPR) repeat protein
MNVRLLQGGLVLLAAVALLPALRADISQWFLAKGDRIYRTGDMNGAAAAWSAAAITPASRCQARFNRGIARYRLGELSAAAADFREAAAAADPKLRQRALYNLGTALLVMERPNGAVGRPGLDEAVQRLQAAVEMNPGDTDAQHNSAVARARIALRSGEPPVGKKPPTGLQHQQDAAARDADAARQPGPGRPEKGKPGAATPLDAPGGSRRAVPPLSAEKALRMLDDARGRETLRSGVAAGGRQEKLTPPEKDW